MKVYNSKYNFCITTESNNILYNSKTGGSILLDDEELLDLLTGSKKYFDSSDFGNQIGDFIKNGFLVEEDRNELSEIREKYWLARGETPVVYTITTTMDCNLGCFYCYENRSKHKLERVDINEIILHISNTFSGKKNKSLHVDWFGGEPMLNFEFINEASQKIQEFCTSNNIIYHASIVSNGTMWPKNPEEFINKNKIRQVQISFDGMKTSHDKVRRYTQRNDQGKSSFDEAINLVSKLTSIVRVDVRFNISPLNKTELFPFIEYIIRLGWFKSLYPPVVQPARVSAYTEKSSFISELQISIEEFDLLKESIKDKLKGHGNIEESEIPYGFPFPKNYVCAALAQNSFVVGADKLIYRCALEVGEKHLAVDQVDKNNDRQLLMESNKSWWDCFDPCDITSCSKCSFLPICFGGCAKKHLDSDQHSLDEQSIYWRANLAKMVSRYFGYKSNTAFTELDQFREGYI